MKKKLISVFVVALIATSCSSGHESAAVVTAKQFCALGDGEGSSLLEIGSWVSAAKRASKDWPAVQQEIANRCPEWRDQVLAKADQLGG